MYCTLPSSLQCIVRILHVIPTITLARGGPTRAVLNTAAGLARKGHEVTIAYTDESSGKDDLSSVRLDESGVELRGFAQSFPKRLSASRTMVRWLSDAVRDFDLVHIHSVFSVCSIMAGRICKNAHVPYIVRPHGSLDPYDLRKKYIIKRIMGPLVVREYLLGAAAAHLTSQEEADRLETYGVQVNRFVVPLPTAETLQTDSIRAVSFRGKLGIDRESFLVLFMSRPHPKKNLPLVIEAVRRLSERHRHVHLAIAGSGQRRYEARMRRMARDLTEKGLVTFCGFIEGDLKVGALLESDVFVLPSQNENFGVAVAEALGAGCPVIISRGVYIAEEVLASGAGLICRQDSADVAEKLGVLIEDRAKEGKLRASMSRSGMLLARNVFGEEHCMRKLLELYEVVVGNGDSRELDQQDRAQS